MPYYDQILYANTEEPHLIPKTAVYLIDEADEAIKNFVTFDKDMALLNGCYNFVQAKRAIFFTATVTDYMLHLVTTAIERPVKIIFPSQY